MVLLSLALGAQGLPPVVGKNQTLPVTAGDSLYELGLRYGIAIEHFAFANNLPIQLTVPSSREITVPTRRILPVSPPENGLVVNLPERGVFLFRNGVFDKFYPIAIGQPGRFATPTGSFSLVSLVRNPTWMPPEWAGLGADTIVPAGPENPLGDRWMGLSLPGVGLHSTTQPTSIGAAASHGCMRMYPAMAHDLFDRLQVGWPVRIEYEPVKIGRDPETGSLCLVAFPDVYGQKPLRRRAEELLSQAGLLDWVEPTQLDRWLAKPQGVPQPFADGDIGLVVDGMEIREPGLLLKNARGVWLCVEALRRAGVGSSYDPSTKAVTLTWRDSTATYGPSDGILLDGRLYLPARLPLSALGAAFHWDGPSKALVID